MIARYSTGQEVKYMIGILEKLNIVMMILMTAAYSYHAVYTVIGLLGHKQEDNSNASPMRYAALICARNEAAVIGELIHSLKQQDYPAKLLDIYVLADNCTDDTARQAKKAGALVYQRFNREKVGKGYALDELLGNIDRDGGLERYEGFFVFDADNIVDPGFVREMNRTHARGYQVITSYRNSKNFAGNWIAYGYAVWFLHEARFINFPRMRLGTSCAVSGTGFLVSTKVLRRCGGWPFHLLTEDIQFSVDCALKGEKIGYCDTAMLYDEQPEHFSQAWNQRLRWSKGFYQIDRQYLGALLKGALHSDHKMSCYDLMMTVAPAMLLSVAFVLLNVGALAACLFLPAAAVQLLLLRTLRYLLFTLLFAYAGLLLLGLLTVLKEWKRIQVPTVQKLIYLPLFPLFMATYIPIALVALFRRVEWTPIRHNSLKQLQRSVR